MLSVFRVSHIHEKIGNGNLEMGYWARNITSSRFENGESLPEVFLGKEVHALLCLDGPADGTTSHADAAHEQVGIADLK